MKQSQSYAFDILTTLFVSCACFYICFQSFFKVFKVSRTRLIFWQLYLYHVLVFTFVFKVFKQASHRLKDNSGFHWIYRPFIHLKSFFFQNFKSFAREENIIYTFYLFGGKTERNEVSKWKHWKFNIAIEGINFFFWISDNRPWHFLRWRVYIFLGWTFACYFMRRV